MKTYYCTFTGYHPVGACLIVTAADAEEAFADVQVTLAQLRLLEKNKHLSVEDLIPVDTESENLTVILDGEY